ncbi:group II intron reverse transcriptase domain-containing protein [Candidatus Uhrbacteria bacterium]|nr:group II intron reverse transcriptase domain-containing protein [Candidatus Uhrbacteria bacterium]
MFEEIISVENLFAAWREFRKGKRKKRDVQHFERHLEDNLFQLHDDLWRGQYCHGPYERFHIFDPKHRIIHKATVRDRVVHHAVSRILSPVFEPSFIFDSYSCRLEKGTHAAVHRLEFFVRKVSRNYTRPCWALKIDIAKFFDSMDHTILLRLLSRRITDTHTLALLRNIISSFSVSPVDKIAERERESSGHPGSGAGIHDRFLLDPRLCGDDRGVPIGNLTSQLFANVYLNPLDHFVKEILRVPYYLRYTDDCIMLHHNPVQLVALLPAIRSFLHGHLALDLHLRKITLRKLRQGIDFLGYATLPHYRVLRTRTKRRMFRRLMIQDERREARVQSYLGMLQHCHSHTFSRSVASLLVSPFSGTLEEVVSS